MGAGLCAGEGQRPAGEREAACQVCTAFVAVKSSLAGYFIHQTWGFYTPVCVSGFSLPSLGN